MRARSGTYSSRAVGYWRSATVGLYILAVIVRVSTWSDTAAADRSNDVVMLLLVGAVIAAILSTGYRSR